MEGISAALDVFLRWDVLQVIVFAAAYGIFIGAIPGLTATMAVALVVPLTFFLDDVPAVAAIVTLEACAIFAGDIPTALLRIPGTPSSAAYVDDAYALTRAGRQNDALGTALVFSVAGGLFGAFVLMAIAPLVAEIAYEFSSLEYFWLTLLGLSCAVAVSRGSVSRGAVALLIGLLISTVGLSAVHSDARFTLGRDELKGGVSFIPAMIGLFGLSEVLRIVLRPASLGAGFAPPEGAETRDASRSLLRRWLLDPARAVLAVPIARLFRRKLHALRSSTIGAAVGMLPGAGADIAAWISYAVSRRTSKEPSTYGHGSVEALGDATTANNSALAGAWIPALILGIPGDSVTAIVIGVLLMKNVAPGPELVEKSPELLYGIYLTFIAANLVLLVLGFLAIRLAGRIVGIPRRLLVPLILVFCIVGSYAIKSEPFDVGIMLAMGILGFALEARGFPLGPVVLGIILGGQLEETFIQSWMKSTSPLDFFARPWAFVLGVLTIIVWSAPLLTSRRRSKTLDPP